MLISSAGLGSFVRMKDSMITHVTTSRHTMFRQATDVVKARLENICDRVEQELQEKTQVILTAVLRNYTAVLVGSESDDPLDRPSHQSFGMKPAVSAALGIVDNTFANSAGSKLVAGAEPAAFGPAQVAVGANVRTCDGRTNGEALRTWSGSGNLVECGSRNMSERRKSF